MNPQRNQLGKAAQARRNAESAALKESSGKFGTGPHGNPANKRARTRQASVQKAIKDQE